MIESLIQYGALGSVAAVSMYQTWIMQKKLFEIIETNTKAIGEFTKAMEGCQVIHGKK